MRNQDRKLIKYPVNAYGSCKRQDLRFEGVKGISGIFRSGKKSDVILPAPSAVFVHGILVTRRMKERTQGNWPRGTGPADTGSLMRGHKKRQDSLKGNPVPMKSAGPGSRAGLVHGDVVAQHPAAGVEIEVAFLHGVFFDL